jgi:molybdate transport system ATP-binding protein
VTGLEAEVETSLREFELAVSLEVEPCRCLALVGPSGAGKSTVLRAIAGLRRPDRGRLRLGADLWLDTDAGVDLAPEERRCGYLFQDYALFPHLSAWRNVAFGLGALDRSERRRRATELLERFGVGTLADARPSSLSGGERQRVALARALAPEPRALLLDEPLSALDTRTRAEAARSLASALAEAGVPSILVTHDFAEAAVFASEIAVIDRGRIVQRDAPAALSAKPNSAFVADFTGAFVLFGVARATRAGTTRVALDGGGEVASSDGAHGPVAIAVYPWEVTLEPSGTAAHGSALNRIEARVESLTEVGGRVRVGLRASQALAAEITAESASRLGLAPGRQVAATWKATATRLVER